MIFQERKTKEAFTYDLEDVFGTLHIESSVKLDAGILDDMVVLMLRQNIKAETINGEIEHEGKKIRYTFKRASKWEDDEKEPCESTPTSTQKPASASTVTRLLRIPILSWCKRFAEAFREAWKRGSKIPGKSSPGEFEKEQV